MRLTTFVVVVALATGIAGCQSGTSSIVMPAAPRSNVASLSSVASAHATPAPTPEPTPISYNASTACIDGKRYENDVLPHDEGEFDRAPFDRTWWGRKRGNTIGGAQYSGFETSWGRLDSDTYFGDRNDGISQPSDDPFYWGADTAVPGSPRGVRIRAETMPAHLVGNPNVYGMGYYSGALDTPVDQEYGFFVMRVRLPNPDPGMFPSAWLLTNNGTPQGPNGPLDGEWDLLEMFGPDLGDGLNTGTILWNSGIKRFQNWGGTYPWTAPWIASATAGTTPSRGYHDYGALVLPGGAPISPDDNGKGGPGYVFGSTKGGVTNFIDGIPIYGHTGGGDVTSGVAWKEMMAMFPVAGGGWLGTPDPAQFPAYYWVQWIRVYRPTNASCRA